jgi:thiamine-monophosphate kinase
MADAMKEQSCGSLGGDLNEGEPVLGATAIGLVNKEHVMMRTGMKETDLVYLSGPVGLGGAYALAKLAFPQFLETVPFKPSARINQAQVISKYASACMDTSDGIIFALDQLTRINPVSFDLPSIESIVHPAVIALGKELGIHPLAILGAVHGEFELCFTIPESKEKAFLADMKSSGFSPVKAGIVANGHGVHINGKFLKTGEIRNMWTRSASTSEYIQGLISLISEFL